MPRVETPILLLPKVETLSINIGRSYGTYQMHKTSAIGTTDIDAMDFIPLIIGGNDIDLMEYISLIIGEDDIGEIYSIDINKCCINYKFIFELWQIPIIKCIFKQFSL